MPGTRQNKREGKPLALYWTLFKAMLREEWRLHKSFVGAVGSGFFPVVIFFFSLVLAATSPVLLKKLDMALVLLVLHLSAVMYGLGVGALAQIGEQVMTRRLGQINMLLQLPTLQPVSFKSVMGLFYVKDAVYYILYSIIPLVGGIAVAIPVTTITVAGVALLFVTVLLTFMTGMALSLIPMGVAGMMFFVNREYVTFFFTDATGQLMLGGMVALQLVGYGVIRKIVSIEV